MRRIVRREASKNFLLLFAVCGILSWCEARAELSESEFYFVIESMQREFNSDIRREFKSDLTIQFDPTKIRSSTALNAKNMGSAILLNGGFIGRKELDLDVFTLILCHELGHALGGAPYLGMRSVEGQADYFATSKCLPRLWQNEANSASLAGIEIPKSISINCGSTYDSKNQKNLCERSNLASIRLVAILLDGQPLTARANRPPPRIDTPDTTIASPGSYYNDYPSPQCRLDTLVAGAFCKIDTHAPVDIFNVGNTGCASGYGARPKCWFKSNMPPQELI